MDKVYTSPWTFGFDRSSYNVTVTSPLFFNIYFRSPLEETIVVPSPFPNSRL